MKKALIVGIDYYKNFSNLYGCVNDAKNIKDVIEYNSDGTKNFINPLLLVSTSEENPINRAELKKAIRNLFRDKSEIALFYFAGHGYVDNVSGYLVTSESESPDEGLSLSEILTLANTSPATNKIVILDSCHSGFMGAVSAASSNADLSKGLTIITASTEQQYANEQNGSGIFTNLLIDALEGEAANLLGDVTPGSIYAHIDQSLGPWSQRPVFKTNIENFVSLRKTTPSIQLSDLRRLTSLFPSIDSDFQLDPSYEPTSECANLENTEKFSILQKFNRINLVVPVGAEHMYFAAMEHKRCKLTLLGKHYHKLVKNGMI